MLNTRYKSLKNKKKRRVDYVQNLFKRLKRSKFTRDAKKQFGCLYFYLFHCSILRVVQFLSTFTISYYSYLKSIPFLYFWRSFSVLYRTFSMSASRPWNSLPICLKNRSCLTSFRKATYSHCLTRYNDVDHFSLSETISLFYANPAFHNLVGKRLAFKVWNQLEKILFDQDF